MEGLSKKNLIDGWSDTLKLLDNKVAQGRVLTGKELALRKRCIEELKKLRGVETKKKKPKK